MAENQVPDFDIKQSVKMLFATPFVLHDWPNSEQLNKDLAVLVRGSEEADEHGYGTRSNAGGWQSPGNLITWKDPAVEIFRQRIEKLVNNLLQQVARDIGRDRTFSLLIDAWANINRKGDYNVVHTHPNCMWSGVYYVEQGEPDNTIPRAPSYSRQSMNSMSRLPVTTRCPMFRTSTCLGFRQTNALAKATRRTTQRVTSISGRRLFTVAPTRFRKTSSANTCLDSRGHCDGFFSQ